MRNCWRHGSALTVRPVTRWRRGQETFSDWHYGRRAASCGTTARRGGYGRGDDARYVFRRTVDYAQPYS